MVTMLLVTLGYLVSQSGANFFAELFFIIIIITIIILIVIITVT